MELYKFTGVKSMKKINRSKGQSLVEYALIIALVAVVAVAALQLLGINIAAKITSIAKTILTGV
ncbi:MAG: hypothetical protein A2044_06455 [Candidatus Firestonebacteria bacterium GWA2_43_8]|nr:MAG: hypothetical protein A2044_06455 [Candidatus Firestonebacteria bacterium GWA2_43_8]